MDTVLYWCALGLVKALQALPLRAVAWLGRRLGAIAYWLDGRHRRMALRNLDLCFGKEKTKPELRQIAKENFRRLGENYGSAIKTASMPWEELRRYVQFSNVDHVPTPGKDGGTASHIVAIGHFGNFELYARFGQAVPGIKGATTYRALKPAALNRLLQSLREQSGCLFFERRTEAEALKAAMAQQPLLLGLLSDQNAGRAGIQLPFLGVNSSTSVAPAVLALRYRCRLFTGFCYRVALGRWRIEAGEEIPTHEAGHARSIEAITSDINRAFEQAVLRDPANWFWVHNRWKAVCGRPKRLSSAQLDRTEESSVPTL